MPPPALLKNSINPRNQSLFQIFWILIVLFFLSSCGETKILGISREEAAKRLERGDVSFILEAKLPENPAAALSVLRSLNRADPAAAFYSALLVEREKAGDAATKSALLFALALESPSPIIREEALQKLIRPVLELKQAFAREVMDIPASRANDDNAVTLRSACLYRLGRYNEVIRNLENQGEKSSWNKAFSTVSFWREGKQKGEVLAMEKAGREGAAFFLSAPMDPAWEWALAEFDKAGADCFTTAERAAFSARADSARSLFSRSLSNFRRFLGTAAGSGEEPLPDKGADFPEALFHYPELIKDSGRAYQLTPEAQEEGIALFTLWEASINKNEVPADPLLKFILPYFLGRIYRQREEPDKSVSAFERALKHAPDPFQADTCVWYILEITLEENPETAWTRFRVYIPYIHSLAYFDDILDRLSQNLVSEKNWKALEEIYRLIQKKNTGESKARYAWILGRAEEENFFSSGTAEDYWRIIYDDKNAPLYYRALAASRLNLAPVPETAPAKDEKPGSTAEFLLGFFRFSIESAAPPYIRKYENTLTIPELRLLAAALAKAGRTDESINLVNRYMSREKFRAAKQDLELLYPRPYQELIEGYAGKTGVKPELLFALIRTESFFMPGAVSWAGATGLCQLMPGTALDMAGRIARKTGPDGASVRDYRSGDGIDLKDPETSVHIGSFYLNYLIETMGSPMSALLAYNGGMGRIRRWRAAKPDLPEDLFLETVEFTETREYGRRVLAAAAVYGYLYYGLNMNEVVADIYR